MIVHMAFSEDYVRKQYHICPQDVRRGEVQKQQARVLQQGHEMGPTAQERNFLGTAT